MTAARARHGVLVLAVAFASAVVAHAGQAPSTTAPQLTPEEMKAFLLKARIVRMRNLGQGVTNSRRATLSDGQVTHDAHVQTVDIAMQVFQSGPKTELNFKDAYRYNLSLIHI